MKGESVLRRVVFHILVEMFPWQEPSACRVRGSLPLFALPAPLPKALNRKKCLFEDAASTVRLWTRTVPIAWSGAYAQETRNSAHHTIISLLKRLLSVCQPRKTSGKSVCLSSIHLSHIPETWETKPSISEIIIAKTNLVSKGHFKTKHCWITGDLCIRHGLWNHTWRRGSDLMLKYTWRRDSMSSSLSVFWTCLGLLHSLECLSSSLPLGTLSKGQG